MVEYSLELSAFAPPIKEQLESQSCHMTKVNYEKYEKIRHAVNMLGFHITSESETRRNAKKLLDKIHKDVNNGVYSISINNVEDKILKPIGDIVHLKSGDYEVIAHDVDEFGELLLIAEKVVDK